MARQHSAGAGQIIKRDGRTVPFDREKIVQAIFKAARAVGGKDKDLAEKLADQVVLQADTLFSGRTPTVEDIQDLVEKVLIENGHAKTAKAYIIYRRERADVRKEKAAVLEKQDVDEVDKNFDVNALRVLKARYLRKSEDGRLMETPKQLFTRVAVHAALPDLFYDERVFDRAGGQESHSTDPFTKEDCAAYEDKLCIGTYALNRYHLEAVRRMYDRADRNGQMKVSWPQFFSMLRDHEFKNHQRTIDRFFTIMTSKQFMANTPAIANFGNPLGMGSACFVMDVEDSIDDIMEKLKQTSIVFKAGGGMGYNFSRLRPEGDFVKSTGGVASGPLSFMELFDKMTDVIKQGGCVACDTAVRTDKGLIQMGELLHCRPFGENPTHHFVYDGKNYNYALLAQHNGMTEVHRLTTELGTELEATWNHLIATVTEKGISWKQVEKLKKGDWVVKVLGGHHGKKVPLPPVPAAHHHATPLAMPATLTPELAELIGFYMADGCFNNGRLLFSMNVQEKDLFSWIESRMKSVLGLVVGERREEGTYTDLVFFSKPLEEYFAARGWRKEGSPKAFVPQDIWVSPPETVCAFLRGLFEGDGTIHPDGYPLFLSSSKTLLTQVQQLLFGLGIVSKLRLQSRGEGHWGNRQMYVLMVLTERSCELFGEKIGFLSRTKQARWNGYKRKKYIEYSDAIPTFPAFFKKYYQWVGRGSGKGRGPRGADRTYYRAVQHYLSGDRTLTRKTLLGLMDRFPQLAADPLLRELTSEEYFFSRITDINKNEKQTMEIEVPAAGCYVANSFLSHNIRRGANMGILNSNHPDIEKFITVKAGNKAMRNFNISVLIMPDFWEHYNSNKPYPLVNPRNGKTVKTVNPRLLFDKLVYQAWESAEPGVIFFDKVNEYNPFYETLGPIVTTNPCVAADTLVSSGNGLEQISHLTADQITVDVRTTNNGLVQLGTSLVQPQQVMKTGIKPCYTLTTGGGYELTATEDHRLLTDDGWKELGQLLPGEKVLIQSGAGSFSTNKALPFVVQNHIVGKQGKIYDFGFPTEWSAELGTVLGWLVGDGWLNQTYHQAGFVFAPEDAEVRQLLQPVLERYCGHALSDVNVDQSASQLRSSSAQVVDFFSCLGVKPVGEDREVPTSLFTAPLDAVRGFLSGLFSADGTFATGPESRHYTRLNSSSLKLLKGVQLLLLNMGIRSRIYNRSTKPKHFSYVDAQGKERVYATKGENYELNVARENLDRFLQHVPFLHSKYSSAMRAMRAGQSRGFYKERFVETVAAIDYVGEREVWDITEPSTHSFIANGFVVHNCGEVLLYGYESCNLGSVNVWSFAREDEEGKMAVDWEGMAQAVRTGVRFLDNVIDVNKWPLPQIEFMALATRKVGLGIMGVGDLLYELGLPYNSPEGLAFMERLMQFVNYHSKLESIELAKERGPMLYNDKSFYTKGKLPFAGYYDRKSWDFDWDAVSTDLKKYGSRNGFTIVIAPTGSISMICGTSSGIEPVYSLVFEKNVKVGSFFYVDPVFERVMKREGLHDEKLMQDVNLHGGRIHNIAYIPPQIKKTFVTAMDISPEDHIRALAAFQKWVDSSISKTNNFPANATLEDMRKSFILAYKLGCKDVTVFRDSSIKDQVLVAPKKEEQATVEQYAEKSELAETVAVPARTALPAEPAEPVQAPLFESVDLNPAAAGMQTTLGPTLTLPQEAFGLLPKLPIDYIPEPAKQFKIATPAEPVTGIALPSPDVLVTGNGHTHNGNGHALAGTKKHKFDVTCPNCNIAPQVKEGCVTCPQCGWGMCS